MIAINSPTATAAAVSTHRLLCNRYQNNPPYVGAEVVTVLNKRVAQTRCPPLNLKRKVWGVQRWFRWWHRPSEAPEAAGGNQRSVLAG